jgi:TRAP-type C4-dicarboxylate transport system permease small subunit
MRQPLRNLERHAPPGFGPVGLALRKVSQAAAMAGGLVFVALVIMSIVSIVGRKIAATPVPGDVELLQLCAAFASSAFFAHCHLNSGDVKVDFFTHNLPARVVHRLDAFGSLLVGLFGGLIAWRTFIGALGLKEAGETTAILGWPVWVGQMLMVPGFVLLALAGLYMAWLNLTGGRARAEGSL